MNDLDDFDTIASSRDIDDTAVLDIDDELYHQHGMIRSRDLNRDEPRSTIVTSRDLQNIIDSIDERAANKLRVPMEASRHIASVRIISDRSSVRTVQGDEKEKYSPMERAYTWKQKFIRLNAKNPRVEIPDTNDPDILERLYLEAIRTDHYCSTSATWLIYMGLGYAAFQAILYKLGIVLPNTFVITQMQVMSHYPQLLKDLGDPGGPSLGSSWPPWLKLTIVICLHTLIFLIVYKLTDSESTASNLQRFICSTGFMGGKRQGEELEADNASMNIGGILGGLGSLFGGGGGDGIGGIIRQFAGVMGGGNNIVDDINIDKPPEVATSDRSTPTDDSFNSRRSTPFDA